MIKIYDTMTRSLRDFVPLEEGKVKMYVCGPTVYNYIHIGNARSVVAFDTIRRYFEYRGYEVTYISNFTDVDDKIIKAARENDMTTKELSDKFIAAFKEDVAQLGVKPATQNPRVIDYMDEIINFVADLIAKGYAYEVEGDVYFRVAKSENYAKLANKTLADLEVGASGRLDTDQSVKEHPFDFALWKSAKDGEVSWQSPWGLGRPGWHIECSVMATEILGETIDIHAGGADLEFPHHTNEIAQSEAKTGKTFANYWMHNAMLNINDEKMSKSLGNYLTAHEMLEQVDGQVLRFFLATQHYRRPLNYTEKALEDAKKNLKYLKNTYQQAFTGQGSVVALADFQARFQAAMDDDFNTANGITVLFDLAKWINSGYYTAEIKEALEQMLAIFGIVFIEKSFNSFDGLWDQDPKRYENFRRIAEEQNSFFEDEFISIVESEPISIIQKCLENKDQARLILYVYDNGKKSSLDEIDVVKKVCEYLGKAEGVSIQIKSIDRLLDDLIEKRQKARNNKEFVKADLIRKILANRGIKLLDTKDGVRWERD